MEQNNTKETWKDIDGYEGLYQVSDIGRIKALPRHRRAGNISYVQKEHMMTQFTNTSGYKYVRLNIGSDKRMFFVHRLVAGAFVENPLSLPEVNHKNEIKTDNNAGNLEWCTRCYNETYGTKRERIQRTKEILNSDYYALMKKNLNHSYGAEKPVLCYMPDGTFVTRYSSISIAAQTIGDCSSHIAACCKGRRKSVRGYIWKYECAGVEPKIIEYED